MKAVNQYSYAKSECHQAELALKENQLWPICSECEKTCNYNIKLPE